MNGDEQRVAIGLEGCNGVEEEIRSWLTIVTDLHQEGGSEWERERQREKKKKKIENRKWKEEE